MQNSKLKPCPFCKSKEIYSTREDDFTIVAQCIDCGASGPYALNEEEAIEAWNSRAESKNG